MQIPVAVSTVTIDSFAAAAALRAVGWQVTQPSGTTGTTPPVVVVPVDPPIPPVVVDPVVVPPVVVPPVVVPPVVVGPGPAARARGLHVDNNVYNTNPAAKNSSAKAFTDGSNFSGIAWPWDMIESTPDPWIAQGIVQNLITDVTGNFMDGRVKPKMVFSLYGNFTGASCAQVAAGAVDVNLINICNFINQIGFPQVAIRPGWEVDGGWFNWGASAPDYIAMFRHVHDVMSAHLKVPTLWEWNSFALRGAPTQKNKYGLTSIDYWPGPQYVDVVGCDSYCVNVDGSDTAFLAPMMAAAAFAKAQGKQVGYSEFGLWDGYSGSAPTMEASGRSVRAMTAALTYFDSLPTTGPGSLAYWIYFDGNPGTGQFSLKYFPKALAVIRQRMLAA